jgi:hypothetical protein
MKIIINKNCIDITISVNESASITTHVEALKEALLIKEFDKRSINNHLGYVNTEEKTETVANDEKFKWNK